MRYEEVELNDNEDQHHFEMEVHGYTAFIKYKKTDQYLFLIHTEVPAELKGKGVASCLVEKTFEYAQRNKLKIVPLCSFVESFLERHKKWQYLVAADADRFQR
jgi:uncharacterized protein